MALDHSPEFLRRPWPFFWGFFCFLFFWGGGGAGLSEKTNIEEFLYVRIVQEAPIHRSHVYGRIKISKRVTQGTFQNLTNSSRGGGF